MVKELVNTPEPGPSVVLLSAVVGFCNMAQQTPRTVTAPPPSLVILPPVLAVVPVIADAAVVEIEGSTARAVIVTWLPYPVPALFVAYARA